MSNVAQTPNSLGFRDRTDETQLRAAAAGTGSDVATDALPCGGFSILTPTIDYDATGDETSYTLTPQVSFDGGTRWRRAGFADQPSGGTRALTAPPILITRADYSGATNSFTGPPIDVRGASLFRFLVKKTGGSAPGPLGIGAALGMSPVFA